MSFMIRVALLALALYVLWRACGRLLQSLGKISGQETRSNIPGQLDPVDELVQDPVCKVYVPRREAIVLKGQEKSVYFCSEKCRDHYVQQGGQQPG